MIFRILKEKLGYELPSNLKDYYKAIKIWNDWWKGYVESFHDYSISDGKRKTAVKRKEMKMAKKVCEDWANLLLNDKTYIMVSSSNEQMTEQTQMFLSGNENEQNDGVLGDSKFWKLGNRSIEKAFALGTSCFYLSIVNPKNDKGKLIGDNVRIKYINDAAKIVPLSWDDDGVSEIALVSEKVKEAKPYYYFQLFLKKENGYEVQNKYFKVEKNDIKEVPASLFGEVKSYRLPCKPFVLLTPNIENNVEDVPMGLSIYSNAIEQLQGCDLAFDNFMSDLRLGKKKVFMDQAMFVVGQNEDGTTETNSGATLENTLFVKTGDRLPGAEPFYQEYNPDLRSNDNEKNIQIALNLLSSKVGLGQHRYSFQQQQNSTTATEVRVSNKDLTESVWKQRIQIQEVLEELTRSILILGKEICHQAVDSDCKITVNFDDSMFTDEEAERMRFLQEISAGVRQKWEYRVKYLGEDEDEAKEMTVSEEPEFTFNEGTFN